jgi:hypothetical protein
MADITIQAYQPTDAIGLAARLYLLAQEPEHNLLLALVDRSSSQIADPGAALAVAFSNETVVGVAVSAPAPGRLLVLSRMTDDVALALAEALAAQPATVPAVKGPATPTATFATRWSTLKRLRSVVGVRERISKRRGARLVRAPKLPSPWGNARTSRAERGATRARGLGLSKRCRAATRRRANVRLIPVVAASSAGPVPASAPGWPHTVAMGAVGSPPTTVIVGDETGCAATTTVGDALTPVAIPAALGTAGVLRFASEPAKRAEFEALIGLGARKRRHRVAASRRPATGSRAWRGRRARTAIHCPPS